MAARAWVTSLVALRAGRLDSPAIGLANGSPVPLRELLTTMDARATDARVGSEAWLRLLGEGGIEDLDAVLW